VNIGWELIFIENWWACNGFGEIGLWGMWDLESEWWFKDNNCYEMLVGVIVDWAM